MRLKILLSKYNHIIQNIIVSSIENLLSEHTNITSERLKFSKLKIANFVLIISNLGKMLIFSHDFSRFRNISKKLDSTRQTWRERI